MKNNWQIKPGDKFVRPQRLKIRPLRRVLRTTHLFSIAYGNVGSSIYYALGIVVLAAAGATPLALGLAGIIFVFTALSYAEGIAMYPESGGSASFARHGFNDFAGFLAGWGLMFGYIVTISISAIAIPSYLGFFWAPLKTSPVVMTGFAMMVVVFLMTINVVGVRESSILNIMLAIMDLAVQAILITLALMFFFNPQLIMERILNYWPSPQDFLFGIAIAAIAFTGIETISQMSEETKRPEVRGPRALAVTTIVVLLVYAGISVSAFSTMTPTDLATNWATDPIAGIASKLSHGMNPAELAAQLFTVEAQRIVFTWALSSLQSILPVLVAVLAATILLIATNAGLLGISRLAFSLSRFKLVPTILGKVHPRFKTPYLSIILFSGLAILLQAPGFFVPDMYSNLGALYAFGSMMSFAIAHASILALRIREPYRERPFRLGLNIPIMGRDLPLTAILGLLGTVAIWVVVVIMQPYSRWVGFSWIAIGLMIYWYTSRRRKSEANGSNGKITTAST
ncbi:MAG: APC family permease [Dehalococcoidia bacterium]|nr:APC family permease [Dehalococcoidia bacterium]MDD5647608.1 APC family permease [Dehalococcoidia bacterium]